jgi:hypothetical protein
MNKDEVFQFVGGVEVAVAYDVGTSEQPHVVSQHGVLMPYFGNPASEEKVALIVPGKIRDMNAEKKTEYKSCSVLHFTDIVSIETYVKPEPKPKKATA